MLELEDMLHSVTPLPDVSEDEELATFCIYYPTPLQVHVVLVPPALRFRDRSLTSHAWSFSCSIRC